MSLTCPVCEGPLHPEDRACPSCGFKILGSTQEFSPLKFDGQDAAPRQAPKSVQRASLTIVRGPQLGTTYQLDDKQMTIGRSPRCDIFLNDMTVSRNHALIVPRKGKFYIQDQQSYNGIWINNQSIDNRALHQDDIVQIGAFCLLYEE